MRVSLRNNAMKKGLLVLVLGAILTVGSAFADIDFFGYAEGIDQNLFVNVGVGYGGSLGATDLVIPPIKAAVDYKLPIDLPITVGGSFAFAQYGRDYSDEKVTGAVFLWGAI
ncbi:hypothetical protein FACS189483_02770 [Spirochaetia bacterium]|nr:hypothetical protein FACS189483_02770 [Spirochaetia bacterium]